MRPLTILMTMVFALAGALPGQAQDAEKAAPPTVKTQTPANDAPQAGAPAGTINEKSKERKGFIDTDGDGLDDRKLNTNKQSPLEEGNRMRHRNRDHFIDSDGDGINDNRCNGMGFGARNRKRGGGEQK